MPGVNTSGRPDPTNYWLGRGKILLGKLGTNGKPYDMRHVGNCKSLTLSSEVETLPHQNSRSGVKVIDREVLVSQQFNVRLVLDELSFDNLALALSGETSTGIANPATADITDLRIAVDAMKGRWYDLVDASGNRLYDVDAAELVIKDGTGTTPGSALTLGTDYELDAIWGRIFIRPESSAFTDGEELFMTYDGGETGTGTTKERTLQKATIGTATSTPMFLSYVGINAADDDTQMLLNLHSVTLRLDGDMSHIGDEFSEITLVGVAGKNETGYPNSPIGEYITHAGA